MTVVLVSTGQTIRLLGVCFGCLVWTLWVLWRAVLSEMDGAWEDSPDGPVDTDVVTSRSAPSSVREFCKVQAKGFSTIGKAQNKTTTTKSLALLGLSVVILQPLGKVLVFGASLTAHRTLYVKRFESNKLLECKQGNYLSSTDFSPNHQKTKARNMLWTQSPKMHFGGPISPKEELTVQRKI